MAEGLTLRGWKVGKKLGAGACSDVYEAIPATPLAESGARGRSFVIKVSPLPSLPAAKAKNKKRKKTPAERHADALYAEHLLYKNHLRDHSGIPFVPAGAYGEDKGFRFLVLERLGRTLEAVLRENGPIPSATAARLGYSILETIKHMHVSNILYVDVKPENFMLDRETENRIFCLDFGISDRYIMATGRHKEHKVGIVVGTPTFLSLNCHSGATSSRRDDIESLLYVLLYLMRGDLPWQDASSDTDGAKIKKNTTIASLCAGLPSGWGGMLQNIRECGFEDRPDYDFFGQELERLAQGQAGSSGPFQWGGSHRKATSSTHGGGRAASSSTTKCSDAARSGMKRDEPNGTHMMMEAPAKTPKTKVLQSDVAAKTAAAKAKAPRSTMAGAKTARNSEGLRKRKPDAAKSVLEQCSESDGDEIAQVPRTKPRSSSDRRDEAVRKAIAGAAAARAAAKRAENRPGRAYNLRSGSANGSG